MKNLSVVMLAVVTLLIGACGDDSSSGDAGIDTLSDSSVDALNDTPGDTSHDALLDASLDTPADTSPTSPATRIVSARTISARVVALQFDGAVSADSAAHEALRFYGTTDVDPSALSQPAPDVLHAELDSDAVYGEVITVSYNDENRALGGVEGFRRVWVENELAYQGGSAGMGEDIWVAADASGSGDGTRENPYAVNQITRSNINPGDRVNIEAGLYRSSLPMPIAGTPGNPVIFEGYQNEAGDVRGRADYPAAYQTLDPAEMPLFEGTSRGSGAGISFAGSARSHIVLRNLQIHRWVKGVRAEGTSPLHDIVLDNINVSEIGNDTQAGSGVFMVFSSAGTTPPHDIQMVNSYVANSTNTNIWIDSDEGFIFRTRSYSNENTDHDWDTDYMFVSYSGDNIVWRELHAEKGPNPAHAGHGFSLKARRGRLISNALIEDCEAHNIKGAIQFRHEGVQYSVARRVRVFAGTGDGSSAVQFRDGASFNIVEQCWVLNPTSDWDGVVSFYDTSENGYGQTVEGNIVRNNVFINENTFAAFVRFGAQSRQDRAFDVVNNEFVNNTFVGGGQSWIRYAEAVNVMGTRFRNNLFVNTGNAVFQNAPLVGITSDNNAFFMCGFEHGTNTFTANPSFVDAASHDFHLRADSPLADVGLDIDGLDVDMDGTPRVLGRFSIGAFEVDP